MREELTLAARVRTLEVSVDMVLDLLKELQLRQKLMVREELANSPHKFADTIYSLLSSSGTPLSKARILALLGGSKNDFAKVRKHLIVQGRMVDGAGTDLEPEKICVLGWKYAILTQEQIDVKLRWRIENRRARQRKRETESC